MNCGEIWGLSSTKLSLALYISFSRNKVVQNSKKGVHRSDKLTNIQYYRLSEKSGSLTQKMLLCIICYFPDKRSCWFQVVSNSEYIVLESILLQEYARYLIQRQIILRKYQLRLIWVKGNFFYR